MTNLQQDIQLVGAPSKTRVELIIERLGKVRIAEWFEKPRRSVQEFGVLCEAYPLREKDVQEEVVECDEGVVAEDPAQGGAFGWAEGVEVGGEEFEGGLGEFTVAFGWGERGVAALDEEVGSEESVLELSLDVFEMR